MGKIAQRYFKRELKDVWESYHDLWSGRKPRNIEELDTELKAEIAQIETILKEKNLDKLTELVLEYFDDYVMSSHDTAPIFSWLSILKRRKQYRNIEAKKLLKALRENYAAYHSYSRPPDGDHKMKKLIAELDERNVSHSHLMIPNKPM